MVSLAWGEHQRAPVARHRPEVNNLLGSILFHGWMGPKLCLQHKRQVTTCYATWHLPSRESPLPSTVPVAQKARGAGICPLCSSPPQPPSQLGRAFRPLLGRQVFLEHRETKVPIRANNTHPQKETIFFAAIPFLSFLWGGFLPAWNFHQHWGWYQTRGCSGHSPHFGELPINEDLKVCTYTLHPTCQKNTYVFPGTKKLFWKLLTP